MKSGDERYALRGDAQLIFMSPEDACSTIDCVIVSSLFTIVDVILFAFMSRRH